VCTRQTAARRGRASEHAPGKVIVEHTNINPNKAAHIGHLRNAVLATRSCVCCGPRPPGRVQNYIDNTGVQVADSWSGSTIWKENATRRAGADRRATLRLLLLDLYARTSQFYGEHPEASNGGVIRCVRSSAAKANWRNWRI